MDHVTILVEGYAYPGDNDEFYASPTSSLIETNDLKILVDPGTNANKLLQALTTHQLKPSDIDLIYLSHYHPDHFLNIRLFPEITIVDGETTWSADREDFHHIYIPRTEIEILPTPGHAPEHTSLLVHTAKGKVCIAQDVFWWQDGQQQSDTISQLITLEDPFASDQSALIASRRLVLEKADWIIPGHGKMFRTPKS